jgi:Zn-dependent protease
MSEALAVGGVARCGGCGAELGPGLLSCPACHRLVHTDELKRLAAAAEQAEAAGDLVTARTQWRQAHDLLPPATRQARAVLDRVAALNRRLETHPGGDPADAARHPAWVKALGPVGVALFFLLTKGKLLLLGLTKAGTLFSMLATFGVFWTAWGWPFAMGLVASIYVHEMGHVAALRRYGIAASAPMFIPGVGAFVRMKQRPADPVEDARVGLAGPIWGLFTAAFCYGVFLFTGSPIWGAIARTGAWINLFNLLPLGTLDGGRGFAALSCPQRLGIALIVGVAFGMTQEGLLGLVGIVAALRGLVGVQTERADGRTFVEFAVLVIALSALSHIQVPVGLK